MRARFEISLKYELFYALLVVANPQSRVHQAWRARLLTQLSAGFRTSLMAFGNSAGLWAAFPDATPEVAPEATFPELIEGIRRHPIRSFQANLVLGLLHDKGLTNALVDRQIDLGQALAQVSRPKQEWLGFVGLYPFQADSPIAQALEMLVARPEDFRAKAISLLEAFWQEGFQETWSRLQPQFRRSLAEKERLYAACTLSEFAQQALLRVTVDESRQVIRAIRGGAELPLQRIDTCYLIPSAFNDHRFWSAYEVAPDREVVYFPYFDPSIALDEASSVALAEPELDPALIFKALGDSTRYAIATLLAQAPRSSAELAKVLAVSKPTVSHHVAVLREAGLLIERAAHGSVALSLRRETLESLSELAIAKLYHSSPNTPLVTTRSKHERHS